MDSDEALEASCSVQEQRTLANKGTWAASPQKQASSAPSGRSRGHQWLCDLRTWGIGLGLLAVVVPLVLHFLRDEADHQEEFRSAVTQIARVQKQALINQLRTSVGSLKALQVLLEVDEGVVMDDFDRIARCLIQRFGGITSLQLAPFGAVSMVYPMSAPGMDNQKIIGRNDFFDPVHADHAMEAIDSKEPRLSGPRVLLQCNKETGILVRLAIFSKAAPRFLPNSAWRFPNGTTLVRRCQELGRAEAGHGRAAAAAPGCSFPGHVVDGSQTHFWGFATMVTLISDLLRPLHFMEKSSDEEEQFDFEILDKTPHPSLGPRGVIKRYSPTDPSELAFDDAVSIPINVAELDVEWVMNLKPQGGWPLLTEGFWSRFLVMLISVFLLLIACTVMVFYNVRGAYKRLERLEEFKRRKRLAVVESAVEDIDRVRFPMCVMRLEDFEALGKLISHEDARSQALLNFLDTPEALEEHQQHTAFVSHQWTGFSHPDHTGVQYKSMVTACSAIRDHLNHDLRWVWVDYFSIPQRNRDQQQVAIDTLAVYAAHSAVFLAAVPSCSHAELGARVDAGSYMGRAWCRLEQLAFMSAHSHLDRLPAYTCGGGTVLQPLFPDHQGDPAFRRGETGFPYSERLLRVITGADALDAGGHPWQVALEVMSGSFTCCARRHPDGMPCDKARVVGAMLGILWRLKAAGADGGQGASQVRMLLRVVDENPEQFFPREASHVFTCRSGSGAVVEEVKELFGDLVVIMDELFEQRSRHGRRSREAELHSEGDTDSESGCSETE